MSGKQKSPERNYHMPKVLLAAGLSAAALTGCANGESTSVETPESAPTGFTLEAPGVRELNDIAKQSVMTGYEGMISDLSMNKEEDSKLPEGVVDDLYSRAYIYNLYEPTQHNVDVGVSDVTDGREKDEDGKSRFWDNTLRIRASEEDPHNELRRLPDGFSIRVHRSWNTVCAGDGEDRVGVCAGDEKILDDMVELWFFNPDVDLLKEVVADQVITEKELGGMMLHPGTELTYASYNGQDIVVSGNKIEPGPLGVPLEGGLLSIANNAARIIADGWPE